MKRSTILLLLTLFCSTPLLAQVTREVEVTKAYIPTVQSAQKPILEAFIADTAQINPDVDYSITPLSINTPLQTQPIKPATVTYWEFNKPARYQVKVGAGLPLNSLVEAYGATHNASVGYLAAAVEHRGIYCDVKNIYDEMINATEVLNRVKVAGGLYMGRQTLAADVSYSNDIYNRYALMQSSSPRINYERLNSSLWFGDSFVDMSRLNFGVGGDFSYFYDNSSNSEVAASLSATIGKDISLGQLLFDVGYNHIDGGDSYMNNGVNIGAMVKMELSDWQVDLGAELYYDSAEARGESESHSYLIPYLLIESTKKSMLSPFVKIGGSVTPNSYSQLVALNPFVGGGVAAQSTAEYEFKGGIEGQNDSARFSYELSASYKIGLNSRYWALIMIEEPSYTVTDVYQSYFDVQTASLSTTSLNLYMGYKPYTNLLLSVDGALFYYTESKYCDYLNSMPAYKASVGAEYTLRKFRIGVNGAVVGEREYTLCSYSTTTSAASNISQVDLPAAFDLSLSLDWRYSDKLSIFAEGSNLCNSNIYPWPLYRGYGARFTAGVKLNFR